MRREKGSANKLDGFPTSFMQNTLLEGGTRFPTSSAAILSYMRRKRGQAELVNRWMFCETSLE